MNQLQRRRRRICFFLPPALITVFFLFCVTSAYAQFSSSVQGIVHDPSGATIPRATITLLNLDTNVSQSTVSDATGDYRFISLAPDHYRITAVANGFSRVQSTFSLETGQTLSLPLTMSISQASRTVEVSAQGPVLNTAETRNQMTITSKSLATLPLAGRSMISLVTLAPGTVGLGTTAGGSPGSGVDNYSTETQVDASANGQGSVANMYVVDGLDVTSAIRPGVLNLTPNPDSIQETSIQTNTYSVAYGRASSIEMLMTTKSGTDHFHGSASDYFTSQQLWAGTEFSHHYAPFHSNNFSGTVGGPILPHHQLFFFFSIEPMRASTSTGNSIASFEDPQFVSWAQTNYPNTLGTKLLTTYKPEGVSGVNVAQTAAQIFPGTCGTSATDSLPCTLPMIDTGVFNSTSFRNGDQFNLRIDKYFKNDRLYGNVYRTTLTTGGPNIRPQFATTSDYIQHAVQLNETHTFSPTTLNEFAFGFMRVDGTLPATGLFSVPSIGITGQGVGFGDGFALGNFIQHNYHWRDVLMHISGSHTLKFGYEGWFGDDVENFQGPHSQPYFQFNNLLSLVQDKPFFESGVAYDPLSGKPVLWNWNAAGKTDGFFAEDSWQVRRNLTVNYGLRFDNFGNPYSRSPLTVFANFFLGQGSALAQQVTNGVMQARPVVFNHNMTAWSPRAGFAWDMTGHGDWVLHGGVGVYHNWPTLANVQEEFRGNPPGPIYPTFFSGTANAPLFVLGNSNTPPFGFTYPSLPATQLDAHGGLVGLQFPVGAIDPNLQAPLDYNYSASLEHKISRAFVADIAYSGSRATGLLSGGGQEFSVSYGVDINSYPGDLIQHNSTVPTRLNPSFGPIYYTQNDRKSLYNALIFGLRGRFSRGMINLSYTRSSSKDDTQVYPVATNPSQYYGPSVWDAPNRVSLSFSYNIPSFTAKSGFAHRLTRGWTVSGTTILQSGTPFTVYTSAPFQPIYNSSKQIVGMAPTSGDYNADGNNYDYPNVSSYSTPTSRQAYLTGIFTASQFSNPTMGQEGNEKYNQFRNPGFADSDVALLRNIALTESMNLQLRFEFYNFFNRVNLTGVDANLASGTFGRSLGQLNPRWIQLGIRLSF